MTFFDAYIFIDWSARRGPSPVVPSTNAIWVGELGPSGVPAETYVRGREEATGHVRRRLREIVEEKLRVLVGFDFPYGYPAGLAACVGRDGHAPWRAVWDLLGERITDTAANESNRFLVASRLNEEVGGGPGPFWGCPVTQATDHLSPRRNGLFDFPFPSRGAALERLRRTETSIAGVQETWKLSGAGSVGSQALLGIPRVRELRDDPALAPVSVVWPFETGFTSRPAPDRGPHVLHAEIWPGIVDRAALTAEMAATAAIRDQAQVRLMCKWARERDREGALGAWFDTRGLAGSGLRAVVEEEGWILGCPA